MPKVCFVFQECCHCCKIGLEARESGVSCDVIQQYGGVCNDVIQECCESGGQGETPSGPGASGEPDSETDARKLIVLGRALAPLQMQLARGGNICQNQIKSRHFLYGAQTLSCTVRITKLVLYSDYQKFCV